jgi:hypothetical protein
LFFENLQQSFVEIVCGVDRQRVRSSTVDDLRKRACGIFGPAHAYFSITEAQGRTLLHFHMLLWTNVSPEAFQQSIREGQFSTLQQFFETMVQTSMAPEFWQWSSELWDSRRHAEPQRDTEPPPFLSPEWGSRVAHLTHEFQVHRVHKSQLMNTRR